MRKSNSDNSNSSQQNIKSSGSMQHFWQWWHRRNAVHQESPPPNFTTPIVPVVVVEPPLEATSEVTNNQTQIIKEENTILWGDIKFKEVFKETALANPQHNFSDPTANSAESILWTQDTLDRIINRVILNYTQHYEEYTATSIENTIQRQFHYQRLLLLQTWANNAGYKIFIDATQMMLKHNFKFDIDEKLPFSVTTEFINMFVVLSVLYESRSSISAENFHAMHFLLNMLLLITNFSPTNRDLLVNTIKEGQDFYIATTSESPANLGDGVRRNLMTAFDDFINCKKDDPSECDLPARQAYNYLCSLVREFRSTLDRLILESDEQYRTPSRRTSSTSSVVNTTIITSPSASSLRTGISPSGSSLGVGAPRSLSLSALSNFTLSRSRQSSSENDITSSSGSGSSRKKPTPTQGGNVN